MINDDGIIRAQLSMGVDYYKGENGVSPTISVVEIQNGHRVIINDVDGEKSFDILDGEGGDGGKDIITRSAEIAYNQVEDDIYRWETIVQPDFTGVNDFDYVRVSLKATHNDVSQPYSTYLTLYPNKPGTAFCGYYDGGIYTLTKIGSNWQGGCVDINRINAVAGLADEKIDTVKNEIGELYELLTEDKSSIVGAINEVQNLAMSNQYTLPTATTSTLGGVKVDGNTITINQDGVISATSSGSGSGVVYSGGFGINIEGGEINVDTDELFTEGGFVEENEIYSELQRVEESIPTSVSELPNDAGYLTSYTETDPTVPDWAKQSTKPTYTASEVGALPADTVIPQAMSDLVNDIGYATETYVDNAIANIPSGGGSSYTAGNGISISGNEISVNTDELVGQGENIATESYVDNAIANIPSGDGGSYTFTNGLTENDGTVSWDLSDRIAAGSASNSVREGNISQNTASGSYSHAEGWGTNASGYISHAEGQNTNARGQNSHAEGSNTNASGNSSHAEGSNTKATDNTGAHAEGQNSQASGTASHAEGYSKASGSFAHSEGNYGQALGNFTHAEGTDTIASSENQHAEGKFNIEDANKVFQHIAGNGIRNARSNSFARDWNGNEYLAGNLYVGCNDYSTTATGLVTENAGGSKVATESYVDTAVTNKKSNLTEPIFNLFTKDEFSVPFLKFGGTIHNANTVEELGNLLQADGVAVVNGYSLSGNSTSPARINTALGTNYTFYKFTLTNDKKFANSTTYSATSTDSLVEFQTMPVFVLGEDRIMVFKHLLDATTIMSYNLESSLYTNSYGRKNTGSYRIEGVLTDYDDAISELQERLPTGDIATESYVDDAIANIPSGTTYTAGNGISIDENNVISAKTNPLIFSMLQMTTAGNDMPIAVKLGNSSTWEEFVENIKAGKVVYLNSSTSYTFSESYKLTPALLGVSNLYAINVDQLSVPMMHSSVSSYPATGTQVYYSTYYYFDGAFLWSWKDPENLGNFIKVRYKNSKNYALGRALADINTDISAITTRIPPAPTDDATYILKCVVSNGTPTYEWWGENEVPEL